MDLCLVFEFLKLWIKNSTGSSVTSKLTSSPLPHNRKTMYVAREKWNVKLTSWLHTVMYSELVQWSGLLISTIKLSGNFLTLSWKCKAHLKHLKGIGGKKKKKGNTEMCKPRLYLGHCLDCPLRFGAHTSSKEVLCRLHRQETVFSNMRNKLIQPVNEQHNIRAGQLRKQEVSTV